MPMIEQEEAILSDIVMAFSLTIVEICRSLEEQQHILTTQFITRLNHAMALEEVPTGPSGQNVKNILTNVIKGLEGKPIAPVHFQQ
jgi:hypothetical protein